MSSNFPDPDYKIESMEQTHAYARQLTLEPEADNIRMIKTLLTRINRRTAHFTKEMNDKLPSRTGATRLALADQYTRPAANRTTLGDVKRQKRHTRQQMAEIDKMTEEKKRKLERYVKVLSFWKCGLETALEEHRRGRLDLFRESMARIVKESMLLTMAREDPRMDPRLFC